MVGLHRNLKRAGTTSPDHSGRPGCFAMTQMQSARFIRPTSRPVPRSGSRLRIKPHGQDSSLPAYRPTRLIAYSHCQWSWLARRGIGLARMVSPIPCSSPRPLGRGVRRCMTGRSTGVVTAHPMTSSSTSIANVPQCSLRPHRMCLQSRRSLILTRRSLS